MIIEYKKETNLVKYFKEKVETNKFKEPSLLDKMTFKSVIYPDVYFHTGALNAHAKLMIENSKNVVLNSSILKDELKEKLTMLTANIHIIYPSYDAKEYKKSEVQEIFFEKHNIPSENRIIYFNALNYERSGFESFCDIISKIESTNFSIFATCTIDKELVYAKKVLEKFNLQQSVIFVEDDLFDVADIFILPTVNKNFSLNVVKAMSNKCVAFVPQSNYSVEILDVFSIMDAPDDSNTAYKIDMLLRVPSELKKLRKENYNIGKKLNTAYEHKVIDSIIKSLDTNK